MTGQPAAAVLRMVAQGIDRHEAKSSAHARPGESDSLRDVTHVRCAEGKGIGQFDTL